MHRPRVSLTVAALLLVAAARAGGQVASGFDVCSRGGPLTPRGIGPLKIGLTPDSLKKVCRVISERTSSEDETTQFLVPVGSDTLLVEAQRGRIYWIQVRSKAFRTTDSVGVGSPLELLLDLDGLSGGVGDGTDAYELHATKGPMCGLVFWVDSETATTISEVARINPTVRFGQPNGPVLDALRRRAKTGTIASIDIRGCG
jgi:hypothetical protein